MTSEEVIKDLLDQVDKQRHIINLLRHEEERLAALVRELQQEVSKLKQTK